MALTLEMFHVGVVLALINYLTLKHMKQPDRYGNSNGHTTPPETPVQ